jgi:hypothetical protein
VDARAEWKEGGEGMIIKPTVGRIVWFYPDESFKGLNPQYNYLDKTQPLAAIVTYVWDDRCINLTVFDQASVPFARTSIILRQEDDPKPEGYSYAEWMPYQVGQAKKHAEDKV